MPRELAAKDSAAPVRAFQLSAVPFLARVMVFITSHTSAPEHVGQEVLFSIVVVKRALPFFFPSPNRMLILFSAPVGGSETGRRGGACDANMSTQQEKKKNTAPVKTRTLLQPCMKTQK